VILAIVGTILAGAAFADGLSTVHFLKKGLDEQNPLFGKYPSKLRLFGEGAAIIAAEIAAVAFLQHISLIGGLFGLLVLLGQSALHVERAHHNFGL
jgi:hypothetical protein